MPKRFGSGSQPADADDDVAVYDDELGSDADTLPPPSQPPQSAPKRLKEEPIADDDDEDEAEEEEEEEEEEAESTGGEEEEEEEDDDDEDAPPVFTAKGKASARGNASLQAIRDVGKAMMAKAREQRKTSFTQAVDEIAFLFTARKPHIMKALDTRKYTVIDGEIHIRICKLSDGLAKMVKENDDAWALSVSDDICESCGLEVSMKEGHLYAVLPADD